MSKTQPGSWREWDNLAVLRRDLLARPRPLQAVDDDAVARDEARKDDAQAFDDGTELDQLGADRAVVGDGEHDLARLIGGDRAVGHQQRLVLAAVQPQPSEEARRKQSVLVLRSE